MNRIASFFLAGSVWGLAGVIAWLGWLWYDGKMNGNLVTDEFWGVRAVDTQTLEIICYRSHTMHYIDGRTDWMFDVESDPESCGMTPKDWTAIINLPSEIYTKCQRSAPLEIKCSEPIELFQVIMDESG